MSHLIRTYAVCKFCYFSSPALKVLNQVVLEMRHNADRNYVYNLGEMPMLSPDVYLLSFNLHMAQIKVSDHTALMTLNARQTAHHFVNIQMM